MPQLDNSLTFWAVNEARALRVAEIMNDFRTLQIHILQLKTDPPENEAWEEGYVLMRECIAEAQALLRSQFSVESTHGLDCGLDQDKVQLQRYEIIKPLHRGLDFTLTHGIYMDIG